MNWLDRIRAGVVNRSIDNWREKYEETYEIRLTLVRNHIGVGHKRDAEWRKELAKLVLVRMCQHDWTATDYKKYTAFRCSYCKFHFLT